jgi:hypothetical protein
MGTAGHALILDNKFGHRLLQADYVLPPRQVKRKSTGENVFSAALFNH